MGKGFFWGTKMLLMGLVAFLTTCSFVNNKIKCSGETKQEILFSFLQTAVMMYAITYLPKAASFNLPNKQYVISNDGLLQSSAMVMHNTFKMTLSRNMPIWWDQSLAPSVELPDGCGYICL